jgi:RNA polymerase sigma factor (sigma-70 family)
VRLPRPASHFSVAGDVLIVRPEQTHACDAELLRLDSGEAFAVVYDRHVQQVFTWARARVGEHAADLTAEVFARAWLSRRRFRDEGDGSAFPWLCGIARNVLLDSLRKRRVEQAARVRLGLPVEVALDPEYEAVERRLSLPEAALEEIATLPGPERELLLLRVVEERPYREIAARLRCSPQTARARVSRTLRRLHLALGGNRDV